MVDYVEDFYFYKNRIFFENIVDLVLKLISFIFLYLMLIDVCFCKVVNDL